MLIRKFFLILKREFFVKPVFGTPNAEIPEKRREIALDHLAKPLWRPKQFKAAMEVPTITPPFLHFFPVAGDAESTNKSTLFDSKDRLSIIEKGLGDGIVLRKSALMTNVKETI